MFTYPASSASKVVARTLDARDATVHRAVISVARLFFYLSFCIIRSCLDRRFNGPSVLPHYTGHRPVDSLSTGRRTLV